MDKSKYVSVTYDKKDRPITNYPPKLVEYLINRYEIEKGSRILDSGCGRGDFSVAFANAGMKVYAVDGSLQPPDEDRIIFSGGGQSGNGMSTI